MIVISIAKMMVRAGMALSLAALVSAEPCVRNALLIAACSLYFLSLVLCIVDYYFF